MLYSERREKVINVQKQGDETILTLDGQPDEIMVELEKICESTIDFIANHMEVSKTELKNIFIFHLLDL